jgi:large conductance mechanosensitive channel
MLNGFKQFLMRGNVIDLAVGIVMGAAFTAIVNGLLDGIMTPLIAAIFGEPDISYVGNFTINGAHFSVGTFLQAVLNFLMVGAGLYFLVILPITKIQNRRTAAEAAAKVAADAPSDASNATAVDPADDPKADTGTREVALLTEIRAILREELHPHH